MHLYQNLLITNAQKIIIEHRFKAGIQEKKEGIEGSLCPSARVCGAVTQNPSVNEGAPQVRLDCLEVLAPASSTALAWKSKAAKQFGKFLSSHKRVKSAAIPLFLPSEVVQDE